MDIEKMIKNGDIPETDDNMFTLIDAIALDDIENMQREVRKRDKEAIDKILADNGIIKIGD